MDATKYEVIDTVINDASGRIIIEAYSDDVDAGGSVSVFFKKFDADHQPKIFDDEETKKNADEILTKTFGEDATVDAVIADPNILLGREFEGYPAEESDNIYLTPRAAFIEFSKIEKKSDEKALTNLVANGATVETLPVTETRGYGISKNGEFWSQHRFNVGIPVEVNGETKIFKVSQLEVIDENDKGKKFSTDYKDGKRGGFTKKTANGMVIAICDADESCAVLPRVILTMILSVQTASVTSLTLLLTSLAPVLSRAFVSMLGMIWKILSSVPQMAIRPQL